MADVEPNSNKKNGISKKKGEKEPEISEEDKQLQEELTMLIERLKEPNQSIYRPALESLRSQIRSSTTSMTSVPKPLKFLRPHYETIKEIYLKIVDKEVQRFCADVVSVLAMTMSDNRECLKFRQLGSLEPIGDWGHEYVRHLTAEVVAEWQEEKEADKESLLKLLTDIVPYLMHHNAETEACDLCMELEKLHTLKDFVDESVYHRVCLYLVSCVPYVSEPENTKLLKTALEIYQKFDQYPEALRCALQLNDLDTVVDIFSKCEDVLIKKQLSYILARQQVFLELNDEGDVDDRNNEDFIEIMSNSQLNQHFLALARELDIMEPKVPEDIYKSHLEPNKSSLSSNNVDSARQNLAASFVNGFVNTGFGKDKLLTEDGSGNKWIYKNKEHGILSATASLGLLLLWDVEGGLTQIDKYLYSSEDYIKSGALLACGIVNSGVRNECEPAKALLSDYVCHQNNIMRIGAVIGLGLAFAGSNRADILQLIMPVMSDSASSAEVVGCAALACGLIAVASGNGDVSSTILQSLMEKSELELKDTFSRYLALGLGLTFLGRQDDVDTILATLEVVSEPYRSMSMLLVEICAYAGTGNVLKIQKLLHICSEHEEKEEEKEKEKEKDKKKKEDKRESELFSKQGVAVLGIGLIALGEDIGTEMVFRTFGHLLRYGEPVVRRTVPLSLALLSASNPKLQILDTLSKFSHDSDPEVAHNSIIAMGIVGAGTNNARLAVMLRLLAVYHAKDANNLFCVRIAQGLTHLGKGTLTLSPHHSHRQLLSNVALAGLLTVLFSCLDVKTIILGKSHYMLFHLVAAMQPRMLVTLAPEEDGGNNLGPAHVSVRVGQAVDVVGQAGKPKTITGFQTHTTPVLLAYGERAELATEEYLPLSPVLEGFVILQKNPDYQKDELDKSQKA